MQLKIKRKNVQRLASLSALGVGALGMATGTAEANVVVTPVNQTVGFTTGGPGPFKVTFGALGSASFSLARTAFTTTNGAGSVAHVKSVFLSGHNSLVFARSFHTPPHGTFGAFPYGKNSQHLHPFSTVTVGGRATITTSHGGTTHRLLSPFNSTDKYFLFAFPGATPSGVVYGWGELTESVSNTTGPDVTLVEYAYGTGGNYIPAGVTTPEPSETVPLALGALILGAAGIRRWRAKKAA